MKIELKKYIKLWFSMTLNSFQMSLVNRFSAMMFLLGKVLRFILFFVFLIILLGKTKTLAGYSHDQVLIFFLVFNIIDTTVQLFFREVYRFRPLVVSGDFDLILTKPMNTLFRVMAGGADVLDLLMLIPLIGILISLSFNAGYLTVINIVLFLIFLVNGFLIATALHILVAALILLTMEIDQGILIYRDISSLGRLPIDMYKEPIRFLATFVLPISAMVTLPAKALMGIISLEGLLYSFFFTGLILFLSLKTWKKALREYTSASS